jgi:uncharacterized protein (DUF4415 family)
MKGNDMKKGTSTSTELPPVTEAQLAQLRALSGEPDTSDIPEAHAANWAHAQRFYKPRKEAISLRVDADILDWLRRKSDKYQTEINRILRETMNADARG